jgi:glycosyltransferase involved in cell wall biosynthesis
VSADRRQTPLVSVGFPVYNEEASLPLALASILEQDYEQLEVIVCDNASTDATVAIAREYAARDPRVTVQESGANRGQVVNFNRCFELASGDYFTWASGHDTRLPQAIRLCVETLEDDADLVICYPRAVLQGVDGTPEPLLQGTAETRNLPPEMRLRTTVMELMTLEIVHGVIRSSALAQTRLFRRCHGSDHVLLAELSLLGGFHQLDDVLYVRVQNRPWEQQEQQDRILDNLGMPAGAARSHPYSVMLVEHARGAWHVSKGIAKVSNACRAALLCWRRWNVQVRAELPLLARVDWVTVSCWRRVGNRRTRAA